MRKFAMAAAVAFLVAASWTMLAPETAEACSCLEPDLSRSYTNSDEVFRATVLKKIPRRRGQLLYVVRVEETYKGCRRRGTIAKVLTTRSGASCGVSWLDRGESYLFNAHRGDRRGRLQIYSCDYNTAWDNLSREDINYLDTRYNCCGRECGCVNAPEVQCFADPCSVAAECNVDGAECVSNFCGGCNAEWYDSTGALVCQGEDTSCNDDADCGDDAWCSPTQDPNVNECRPYQSEGDWCGGFTPPWGQSRCAPGLVCTDTPPFIADAPGICREPCNGNRECGEEDYCSPNNNVCRDDGACYADNDCDAEGNDYLHAQCAGYGVCNDGQCGWECGDPSCRDYSNSDFGFCEALLGWGIVNGSCEAISGCPGQAQGYRFYDSQEACQRACEDDPEPECRPTGCSGQICADEDIATTCEWLPEYACYQKFGQCGRQEDGACGWSPTRDLLACLESFGPDTCNDDADCGDDAWCSPTQDPNVNECRPYQSEGDWCGGFTPIWGQSRCHPDLVCTDTPPLIADAPGICREPCNGNRECGEEDYCSPNNNVCRDDGACYADNDCEANGNDYPHIACVGYGVCNDGQCGWECGDASCRDLANTDFGFCRFVLGWGVVNGSCQLISGCPDQAQGYTFYENEESCQRACGDDPEPECRPTGCSGQICADEDIATTCEWLPEYACYQEFGECGRQADGACGWSQTRELLACLEGSGACEDDADCGDDAWCSPTQDLGVNECRPYQSEGDWCGGFTPIWGQSRCHPDLICTDVPPFIADAPGICREPCNGNRECGEEDYCSPNNNVCRDDGACYADNDCEANGNDYPHIACVGYGVCNDGQCGWECGDASCRDLANTDFGFCRFTLGWGIVGDSCQLISGCPDQAQGYTFYENEESCQRACGDDPEPVECTSDLGPDACEAANGEYGRYGLLGNEFCLCRTSDVGEPCRSGQECEGTCVGPDEGCFEASSGTCSEFVTTFGCYCTIFDGQGAFLCVD